MNVKSDQAVKKLDYNARFREKIGKYVFINIKKEAFNKYIPLLLDEEIIHEELLFPINSKYILEDEEISRNIKATHIVEGMFFVLGADPEFKYNKIYINILKSIPDAVLYIKGIITKEYESKNYEDAFIYLRGLLNISKDRDVFINAVTVGEMIRKSNFQFGDVQMEILNDYKENHQDAFPYYIEGLIYYSIGELNKANIALHNYISKGGEMVTEAEELIKEIEDKLDYKKAMNNINDKPEASLSILLDKLDRGEYNASILYYIAVAYRNLNLPEKAIFYLNEALNLDNSYIDVINELGINHASLGDYDNAVIYFRKAFEAARSIEICCNLILSYYYNNDIDNAVRHIKIAEIIDSEDEILKDIKKVVFKGDN
ncbi:tetratricopeptide repeat protein [Clostridium polynesiense]|uniref:tetratricopeptide repeat protein n=1 Tax=Clostridium polynesiense TaxID=1325933 RepID=UPI0011C9B071|nr:tetratricopeptide repeat protein [Clostridium polynesiense]